MDKNTYRIKIEVIGDEGEHPINEKFLEGIECNGFVIIGDREEESAVCIHALNVRDIAGAISHNDSLLAASVIAKAYNEANDMIGKREMNRLASILRGLDN